LPWQLSPSVQLLHDLVSSIRQFLKAVCALKYL
jgi:hypothetical protein